ncbi:MAG TPA: dihydroorotate dehydrogenase [Acidimicrobiales bacterium]|nr:dihydroorotate dehydrogenase [Acidimicrobiales bacterium]
MATSTDMTARVGELALPNPVMTASGTAGHGAELAAYFDLSALGAVVVKSLSAEPWAGNPAPRLLPVPGGMLNSVGLQNSGIDAWAREDLPALAKAKARTVVSVWGRSAGEYAEAGRRLAEALAGAPAEQRSAVVAVEANISCPNIEDRQRMFSHSAEGAASALGPLMEALKPTGLPVWAKLSPNVTDLVAIAGAALASGASALTLVNTLMGLAVDPATGLPRLGGGGGGLSGPALHAVAVRAVYDCRQAFPAAAIVGVGGVNSGYDAAEMLAAGADAVQVGTATFVDPRAPMRVLEELMAWCSSRGIASLAEVAGGHAVGPAASSTSAAATSADSSPSAATAPGSNRAEVAEVMNAGKAGPRL